MRSWTPRQPSPGLKAALFPAATREEADFSWAGAVRWFAPAMAVLCLSTFIFTKTPGNFVVASSLSLVTSDFAAAAPGDHNVWPRASFELTNTSASNSSAGPIEFESRTTNNLQF